MWNRQKSDIQMKVLRSVWSLIDKEGVKGNSKQIHEEIAELTVNLNHTIFKK